MAARQALPSLGKLLSMSAVRPHRSSPARSRLLLAALASALILGVVAMHSLLVTSPEAGPPAAAASTAVAQLDGAAEGGQAHHEQGAVQHGEDGGLSAMAQDCGPLLAACLALLLSVAGLLQSRRGRSWRVLWQRVRATRMQIGLARARLELLTPLQRTAVLRC